jgi:phosphonate metabolism protein PhnN/1,5-bisphosphokinase (PRPP-forming)
MTARYALYFTPRAGTAWARFGDEALAGDARRYGFHATLKPPFRLAREVRLADLQRDLDAYCARLTPFPLPDLRIARLDDFIAIVPGKPEARVDAIAAHCVQAFDRYRAPLNDAELAKRRARRLSPRQEDYLLQWGYPYVLEEFRFHLSLTAPLARGESPVFAPPPQEALLFDAISLVEEPAPGADFRLLERYPFGARGRLLYVVGPSGAGKDSVLAWVRKHLPGGAPIVFAQRTITRPADPDGESHRAVSAEQFATERAAGAFAMHWVANGCDYGIPSELRSWLAQGLTVVVNGSRGHLPRALADFPALEVVHVTAAAEALQARLASRGRERGEEIRARLERAQALSLPPSTRCTEILNDAAIDVAGRRLLSLL